MPLKRRQPALLRNFASSLLVPAALAPSSLVVGAMAQGVLVAPPPVVPAPVPTSPLVATNLESAPLAGPGAGAGGGTPASRPLLDWGPIHLHPHFAYQFLYGSGLQAQPGQPSDTIVHTISPGLLMVLGSHWTLDYTPSLQYYSSANFQNSVSHSVNLTGATSYQDWFLGLAQGYNSSFAPQVETGAQTSQENFTTALSASHPLNSKLSLDLAVNQNFRLADAFTSSREWSTLNWLNYQFWPSLGAGLGAGLGYVNLSAGSDMLYEQALGRITWQPGSKLSLTLSAGLDDRQFLDSQVPDLLNPIFSASLQYHLFEPTTLSLNASRSISPSYFANQISESTMVSAGLQQRLLHLLQLGLNGGYSTADYVTTSNLAFVNRSDEYFFFGVQLSCPFLQRGTVAVFYQHSENASNQSAFGYASNQGGVNISYHF